MEATTTPLRTGSPFRCGLAWLPPFWRLLFVVFATTLPFLAPPSWGLSAGTFLAGFALLAASPRFLTILRRPILRWILLVPFLTTAMLMLGNTLFSPPCGPQDGQVWDPLRINLCGVNLGIRAGLRFGGVNAIGIAWLLSSRIPEFYDALAPIPFVGRWALPFARRLQFSLREYAVIGQSLAVRGLKIRSLRRTLSIDPVGTLRRNRIAFLSLLRSLMHRFLRRTALFAYASESHVSASGVVNVDTAIDTVSLFVRPVSTVPDVIRGASFSVPRGEFVLVTGRDAAGKSTLLRALAGLIPCVQGAVQGTLKLFGTPTDGFLIADFGKRLAYFSQEPEIHLLGLTVLQELELAAASDDAVEEASLAMGLTGLLDRQTTTLSGGETVRLVLASVLARAAPLLLLDDPFDQLDSDGRAALLLALSSLRHRSTVTVLIADRSAHALRELITSILVVEDGSVRHVSKDQHHWDDTAWLERLGLSSWAVPHRVASAPGGEAVAALRGVSVELGDKTVVDRVIFELQRGEIVLVQGPNGSGKTTAMLALVGALDTSIILGERWSVEGTKFGYVFQDTALQFATATVLEELFLSRLARYGDSDHEFERRAHAGLTWVGVPEASDPFDLHPSHQKLLAFATMSLGADVLVVDEPTIGAGSWAVERLLGRLLDLRASGTCIVLISHDTRFLSIADRVLQFSSGSLIGTGRGGGDDGGGRVSV